MAMKFGSSSRPACRLPQFIELFTETEAKNCEVCPGEQGSAGLMVSRFLPRCEGKGTGFHFIGAGRPQAAISVAELSVHFQPPSRPDLPILEENQKFENR